MDEHLICSTASAPTPSTTAATPTSNEGPINSYSASEEKVEREKEKEKEKSVVDVEASQPKRRKTTSEVWNDFERTVHGDKSVIATCKHCGKIFNGTSVLGTTHLNNHRKTCKRRTCKDVGQHLLALSESTDESALKLANFKFDSERTRKDFARMIAKHCYPFNMVDHEYFQIYVNNINPMVKFYSRDMVRDDVMDVFQEEKEKLYAFLELEQNFKNLPTDEEWKKCKSVGQCLEVFNDITKHMSDYKYPTANFYFLDVCNIYYHLLQWKNNKDDCIRSMVFSMRLKFEKYWNETGLFMMLGVILDPRYKMEFIVYALSAIYGDDADYYIKKVQFDVADIYSEYSCKYGGSCCSLTIGDASDCDSGNGKDSCDESSRKKPSEFSRGWAKYMQQHFRDLKNAQKSELDMYLEESLFPREDNVDCFDILHWWKSITEYRSLLLPDDVEALICLKDWLPSNKSATTMDE
ncbi:hypothetical protein NE237_024802 [Protea cynaroides]|uniref:BED-type domain-containing protein n=1 Tax=Protea cynaroides TaxID=273540 RepID=A0A9Q0JZJ5_9MAGN|nr:hypothetical protein NE237_024802 [Protea cynaroides]